MAAVLGGVALIDLFGSLRRPPLPTLARPGPQNSFLLRIPFRPPPPLHPSFAPVFPCQRLRRTTRHAHASLSLHPRSSFRRLSGTLFTFRSYFPSIICQPTQVVILPPQRNKACLRFARRSFPCLPPPFFLDDCLVLFDNTMFPICPTFYSTPSSMSFGRTYFLI